MRSDDSLMRDAIERSRRRLAAAEERRRQQQQGGAASSWPPVAAAQQRGDTSSPPSEGSEPRTAWSSAPPTPLRQPVAARRARERSLAQMGDVAEAAETGAWLHEMLCRYHDEQERPAAFDGSAF